MSARAIACAEPLGAEAVLRSKALAGEERHHSGGAGEVSRKDQVPHQESAPGTPPRIQHQIADLAVHLLHGHLADVHVVPRSGYAPIDAAVTGHGSQSAR